MKTVTEPTLAFYLPLHEPDGAAFVSRDAHGHPCAVSGAQWRPGGHYFDGVDDYIALPSCPSLEISGSKTVLAWFRTASVSTRQCLVSKHDNDVNIYIYENGSIRYSIITEENGYTPCFSAEIAAGRWYFAGLVFDSDAQLLSGYLDGEIEGAPVPTEGATCKTDAEDWEIGIRNTGIHAFGGMVGDVLVYRRALAPQEIQRSYLATKWRYR